jgi:DNA-binding NarL/FixJ family response regulator
MDIRMPELDGIEATRLIKSERPQTGVVLITAYEQDELAESGMQAGADEFVMKGIFGADLVQRVRRASEWTSTP